MASGDDERRMVFDIRGRRKNVVKAVYAVLALLMGLSLFLTVGPFSISEILNDSTSSDASAAFVEQAERVERKVQQDPDNPELLASLTKAQINAGNAMAAINPETGAPEITSEGLTELQKASQSWSEYLKATDEPSGAVAQSAAQMLFTLAQYSRTGQEAETNIRAAAQAQQIVADQRPSLGSLSTLAIYRVYSFDYPGGKEAQAAAKKLASTKFERENLDNELEQIEKRAREFEKQLADIEKEAQKAREKGEPSLANPLAESNPLASP
jgi:predicted ribosome quality control (RQC) complex YloA/Tae2 family protein